VVSWVLGGTLTSRTFEASADGFVFGDERYAGSKGAVSAITKGLAAEFAKDGIRCNAVCPVAAETGMMVSGDGYGGSKGCSWLSHC